MAALGIVGGLISAVGSVIGGVQASEQADAQAAAQKVAANERIAVGQREAIQRSKEAKAVLSRQQAVAAASGGGASDPTVINLEAGVLQQGQYQSDAALYEGNTQGANLNYQAKLTKMAGRQALFAGFINGASSMINGFSNFNQFNYSAAMPSASSSGGYYYG